VEIDGEGQIMKTRILFHFHTRYSYDSNLAPEVIVDFASANDIAVLAPTDHDTIRGALEIRKLAFDRGIRTIIGAEYLSDRGDIIGLFLNEEILARDAEGIIREIKSQGGMVVIPHPYRSRPLADELLQYVDGIEVFNSRLPAHLNAQGKALADRLLVPHFVGADAHLARELGLVIGEIDETPGQSLRQSLAKGMQPVVTQPTLLTDIHRSQMIRARRIQRPGLWLRSFGKMIVTGISRRRP
jgi:predicted metal-dependent phosphoesterase TrpH